MPTPRLRRSSPVLVVAAAALVAVLASSCSWFESDPPTTTIARPPEADVAYGADVSCVPGVDPCTGAQTVDIYRSDEEGPNPVLIWIHGGGFVSGDKATGLNEHLAAFLDAGWDIVAMNYRLSTDGSNQFPAALHDAKRVVRWVKASAEQQDWDPTSVATAGHSAGGNLAAMLAVTADVPELEPTDLTPELAAVDSSVIAAVAIAPVSDLAAFGQTSGWERAASWYVGCDNCPDVAARASVIPYVDANSAPLLLLHGADDPIAPPQLGDAVVAAYDAASIGDRVDLIVVRDGPEEFRGHNPDFDRFDDRFVEFIDEHRPEEPVG